MELKNLLLQKIKHKKLAPFYIFKCSPLEENPEEHLSQWMSSLIVDYLAQETGCSKALAQEKSRLGHGDILWISLPESQQDYKIDSGDLTPFFKAQAYPPLELNYRLIVIESAEAIHGRYANKMLKTLEEPQEQTAIFFLNYQQRPLLSTIESRALCLSLPPKSVDLSETKILSHPKANQWWHERLKRSEWEKHRELMETFIQAPHEVHGLLAELKKDRHFQQQLLKEIIHWQAELDDHHGQKRIFLEELKWFLKSQTYHNPLSERFFGLLQSAFI
jgi:hypothetical protein